MGKSTISMVIFNSYVKLPEGTCTTLKWPSTWRGHHCFVLVDAEFHQLQAGKLNGYNFSAEARHASERYALRFTARYVKDKCIVWHNGVIDIIHGSISTSDTEITFASQSHLLNLILHEFQHAVWPHVSDGHSPWGCGGLLLHYERHRNNPIMNHIIIYIYILTLWLNIIVLV